MPVLVTIGKDCTATHIAEEHPMYMGRSPFDWTMCSPASVAKIIGCMYTYAIPDIVSKFFQFEEKGGVPGVGNYNREFDINAPHHDGAYAEQSGGIYHPSENTKEKVLRRFERLKQILENTEEFVYFLYVGHIKPTEKKPYGDLLRVRKVIGLFRPYDTFRIVFLDSSHTSNGPPEIDCITTIPAEEHRYWIYPAREVLERYLSK